MQRDLQSLSADCWRDLARDRRAWRHFVSEAKIHFGSLRRSTSAAPLISCSHSSQPADPGHGPLCPKTIKVPTAGAQAFPMDGIGRLGHDPPRRPSADWWVLTTADAAGTNGLTCLPKHGGARDKVERAVVNKLSLVSTTNGENMWRNYHEDWERKKTYLIRSLFHDIPLLSPVPEDHESRHASSRDVSPLRSYSPLPPLIIEKLPNRHDHPPEFYDELEKKMKKLYRRLYHNEISSSLEDLQELYKEDVNDYIAVDKTDKVATGSSPSEHDETHFVTALESNYDKSSEIAHSILDTVVYVPVYKPSSSESDNEHSVDCKARSEEISACDEIQLTTHVMVHEAPSLQVGDLRCVSPVHEDQAGCSSPILVLKPLINRSLVDREQSSNDQSTEKTGSNQDSDIGENTEKEEDERTTDSEANVENDDFEQMRRQRCVSPSLGSLQNDLNDTETLSIGADVQFKRSASLEHQKEEDSLYKEDKGAHNFTFIHEIPWESGDVSFPSSFNRLDDSSQSSMGHSSQINGSLILRSCEMPAIKRRKYENLGVQTSITAENERIDWHHIRNHFFVGIPKIYKLCSCDEHVCTNQETH
ncbi:hypothetical protein evm_009252 [Chilo suppressalis]|nr:hypothetical protein evm_009252 [Chilo suppressalis]